MSTLNISALITADSPKGQKTIEIFRNQYNIAGLSEESADILNEHPEFAVYLAEGIRQFSAKIPNYDLAQLIFKEDFITPEEITKACPNIVYTVNQVALLAKSLPSEKLLKWCKENDYVIMPAPPVAMSILDVRNAQPTHFHCKTGGWYADQKFAYEDKTSFGWLIIKKIIVLNSASKNWEEQKKLLSVLEKVPNVAEMCWFITTYFKVRDVRLFENIYVRTSSIGSASCRVFVGIFDSEGLSVYYFGDNNRSDTIGLSAVRK